MRGTRIAVLAGLLALATATSACALLRSTPAEAALATLVIENDASLTVTAYAVRQGTRFRLGTVPGLTTREFEVRRHMLESAGLLRVMVDPIGSTRRYVSQSIMVNEGDVIELQVSGMIR